MSSNNYTRLSIIVLGETGQGKSLFCKLFSKSDFFISADTGESVTIDVKTKTFRDDNKMVEICLIDTPGSNDSRGSEQSKTNLEIIKNEILHKPRINCVIIVMNAQNPRMSDSIKTSIRNICSVFPLPDFWEHVIIFWTHFFFQDKQLYIRKKKILKLIS